MYYSFWNAILNDWHSIIPSFLYVQVLLDFIRQINDANGYVILFYQTEISMQSHVYGRKDSNWWFRFPFFQFNFVFRPMEVQRERYGPALYTLTKLVLAIRLYLHLSLARYGQKKMWASFLKNLHFPTSSVCIFVMTLLWPLFEINRGKDDIAALQQAVVFYTEEFGKFTVFIG
jgi:hypothetical protein